MDDPEEERELSAVLGPQLAEISNEETGITKGGGEGGEGLIPALEPASAAIAADDEVMGDVVMGKLGFGQTQGLLIPSFQTIEGSEGRELSAVLGPQLAEKSSKEIGIIKEEEEEKLVPAFDSSTAAIAGEEEVKEMAVDAIKPVLTLQSMEEPEGMVLSAVSGPQLAEKSSEETFITKEGEEGEEELVPASETAKAASATENAVMGEEFKEMAVDVIKPVAALQSTEGLDGREVSAVLGPQLAEKASDETFITKEVEEELVPSLEPAKAASTTENAVMAEEVKEMAVDVIKPVAALQSREELEGRELSAVLGPQLAQKASDETFITKEVEEELVPSLEPAMIAIAAEDEVKEMAVDATKAVANAPRRGGRRRKRGRCKAQGARAPTRAPRPKADEEVCFICFDGGELVVCDRK